MTTHAHYTGRFAPSPSGPLHFGSLIAALGSYLQARQQGGRWLLRIDDIDPPREVAGAADGILRTLEQHGLHWDGAVYYQSQQSHRYQHILDSLSAQGLLYQCDCTRKQIKALGGSYPGTCRNRALNGNNTALRFLNRSPVMSFEDALLGTVELAVGHVSEDFILRRRDGYYAYHLAAVVDDHAQGITQVVRGADLLEPTACQIALFNALQLPPPEYAHLPVAASKPGFKLSKQNHAEGLDDSNAVTNLWQAMEFLGLQAPPDSADATAEQALQWAISHWRLQQVPAKKEIVLSN